MTYLTPARYASIKDLERHSERCFIVYCEYCDELANRLAYAEMSLAYPEPSEDGSAWELR